MAKNELFRVALFGGYNKVDVQEYIKSLENEIDTIRVQNQKDSTELEQKLREAESNCSQLEGTQEQLEKELESQSEQIETLKIRAEAEEKNETSRGELEELRKGQEELKLAKQDFQLRQDDLIRQKNELRRMQEEFRKSSGEQEEKLKRSEVENRLLLKEVSGLRMENMELQDRCRELKEKLRNQTENSEHSFADQELIAAILEDARENAKLIKEETTKEREQILEDVRKEAEQMKKELAARINSELEDKGIQLLAAKHKIGQYMKEVKSVQEGLYNVYSRMNFIVENMPVRIDNYWDGEHYQMLEDMRKEEKGKDQK